MTKAQAAKTLAAKRPAKWMPMESFSEFVACGGQQTLSPTWRKDRNRRKRARKTLAA